MPFFFKKDGHLTQDGRKLAAILVLLSLVSIVLLCFLPQKTYPQYKQFTTPGIVQIGRLYILPIPFNTLINGRQITSFPDFCLVLLQNVTNVFLLYPLILPLIFLFEKWQSLKSVIVYTFCISLTIELTQLFLDVVIDAGRVFEVDDLWTNTLGGVLAYYTYKAWMSYRKLGKRKIV